MHQHQKCGLCLNSYNKQMAKDSYLRKILGEDRFQSVRLAKVLMVGAGGIGCELLKNLVLTGFGEIHIVDLDTITLSNLNRQFLFRQKDIDKLKSLTVAQAVQSFNYFGSRLIPHHGNVMNTEMFPIEWWAQFDYIYNALDNLEARRFVNRMALFLRKPLMESGTTGFDGQTQPIYPYQTECFECQPKATPQTFPVCTIRSTPLQPVHCIVWAKEFLFTQLFDETSEKEVSAAELAQETSDDAEIQSIVAQANELAALKSLVRSQDTNFPDLLVQRIYHDDIIKALRLESLWKTRTPPVPLDVDGVYRAQLDHLQKSGGDDAVADDTRVWLVAENLYVLHRAATKLRARVQDGEEVISFDKDDEDTLDFVASAANLRCHVFHIATKSKFDIKQIAGNIIPAIATTNAIISGFSDLGSLPFFGKTSESGKLSAISGSKCVFISIKPNKRVTSAAVEKPNPRCASSGIAKGIMSVRKTAFAEVSLQDLIDMLVKTYKYNGDISLILGLSRLIYDFDFDDNTGKTLGEINGFAPGEVVLVQDEEDELENLELYIAAAAVDQEDDLKLPKLALREKAQAPAAEPSDDDMETTVVVEDEPPQKKRKLEEIIL